MKTYIRRREANTNLIIVFGGWGTDQNAFLPLCSHDHDLILYYNYSADEPLVLPDTKTYENVTLIGWSLGIWAAEFFSSTMNLKPDLSIAVCGTPVPADNLYGIPLEIFEGTINKLTEQGMEKFNLRLFGDKGTLDKFRDRTSQRSVESFREELRWMYNRIMETNDLNYRWDIAIASPKDRIFPFKNVSDYWSKRDTTKLLSLDIPHYPFFKWSSFLEMIDDLKSRKSG
ncbi:MAG: DUF452 family protein [Bacteroidales bacterium]|nr:DUF452 family protein [Bacteroidales bacterium]